MLSFDLFRHEPDLVHLAIGETLLRPGDTNDVMYVLLDGHIELSRGGDDVESLGPGDFFGEDALLEPGPCSLVTTALSECTLARISRDRVLFLVRNSPGFAIDVIRVMARRLRGPVLPESDQAAD
ncbi:MAG: Crp/Fnr family transcriptional regulator [Rhodocyclaceae bacterium]|nr:Crp/Fnr family transcriptional regulator [Rhodocyclaceae bacterium]